MRACTSTAPLTTSSARRIPIWWQHLPEPRRHTDLLSEAMEGQTRPLRWLLRVTVPVLKLARVIIALQAIGGVIGIVLGVPTLNGPRVAVGFGQSLLAAIVFG